MTREEAIKKLQKQKAEYLEEWVDYSGVTEAFDMAIESLSEETSTIQEKHQLLEETSTNTSTNAVQGEWIEYTDCEGKTRTITCSKCGWAGHSWVDFNYCPSCGARMKGRIEE